MSTKLEWLSIPEMNTKLLELRELLVEFLISRSCSIVFFKIPKDYTSIERAMNALIPRKFRSQKGGGPDRIIRVKESETQEWKSFRVRNIIRFIPSGTLTRNQQPKLDKIQTLILQAASAEYASQYRE